MTGERLSDSADLQIALQLYRDQPWARLLDPEAAIQSTLFQQFLVLLVLSPVAAAMSLAAYSVIGEKQARSLEPLLATPITTFELLLAKVLGAFLPALALSLACFAVDVAAAALLARPGVFLALLTPRSIGVLFLMGPMASLTALTLAVCVSSRVNDAAQRAAARRARGPAPDGAARRPDHRRLRGDGADHPSHHRRAGRRQRRPDPSRRVTLRPGNDPDAMEVASPRSVLNESGRLTRVAVKHARDAFVSDERLAAQWKAHGFTAAPDLALACRQYDAFLESLAAQGAERQLPAARCRDHDRLDLRPRRLAGDAARPGALLDGQAAPRRRTSGTGAGVRGTGRAAGRVIGAIQPPGLIEGGDVVWFDERTVAVGRGYRTNAEGIRQFAAILGESVTVVEVPLPHWRGPGDVMHLMSLISPVDDDLAVVYSPLLPVPFRERLLERGIALVETPDDEFDSMGTNVLGAGAPPVSDAVGQSRHPSCARTRRRDGHGVRGQRDQPQGRRRADVPDAPAGADGLMRPVRRLGAGGAAGYAVYRLTSSR